jgi:hypothetical protein
MRKSNTAKNNTLSGNCLLLVAAILSILMIVASSPLTPMPLSPSSAAFASYGGGYHGERSISDIAKGSNNNNQVGGEDDYGGLIGNLISQHQSPQAYAGNVNEDNKVIIVENCEDGEVIINDNDQIIQTNTQSFNQEANNQVGEEVEEEEEEEDEDS